MIKLSSFCRIESFNSCNVLLPIIHFLQILSLVNCVFRMTLLFVGLMQGDDGV